MSQTKRKRRRKHRGTQAGTVEARGRTGRPQTRAEARKIARDRRSERLATPPSWRRAMNRAAITSLLFGVFVVLVLGATVAETAPVVLFAMLIYVPASYYTDRWIYNRSLRRSGAARADR